jgi:hypothetical protein
MSWNNVIPAELLLKAAAARKEVENPKVVIPDELVTDCLIRYEFEGHYGVIAAHKDHPAFDEVRRLLKARGYIEIPEYPCWNGDRVLKRFQFNGFQLEVGDTFYSAAAWAAKISVRSKKVVDISSESV